MTQEKHENIQQVATDVQGLLCDIRDIISNARSLTRRNINSLQVLSNYMIGLRIVAEEQNGQKRAKYGKETLKQLSLQLTREFGRGYSHRNLELMRKFYLTYKHSLPISQTVFAKSGILKHQDLCKMQRYVNFYDHYLKLEEAQMEWDKNNKTHSNCLKFLP